MTELSVPEPTYTTPELVAETMGLPDPSDPLGFYRFDDTSSPTYDMVCRMIVAAEGEIDRRTYHSWRVNRVSNLIADIDTYQWDENALRSAYWARGGNFVQLEQDILPWDPQKGDRLELRTRGNSWRDISFGMMSSDNPGAGIIGDQRAGGFWFDYGAGRLFLRTRLMQTPFNGIRISYRYGSEEEPPAEIQRLCSLMVADRIIQMGVFTVKVGQGGDINGIKQSLHQVWQEEIGMIMTSWQRPGPVYSLLG